MDLAARPSRLLSTSMEQESAQRPHSLRSVASNSTIASATSLSRRPRTRKRSRTVTGASGRPSEPPLDSLPVHSDLPYLSGSTAQESSQPLAIEDNTTSELPSRPPKSPLRLVQVELLTRSSDGTSSNAGVDATVVSEPLPTNTSTPVKHAKPMKASSLPHLHIGYRPQPSAFSRDPALTPVVNVRDSVSTHQSGTSSSLYPPSTATISRADSPPTPPLISHDFESVHQSAPMNPEVPEVREYDSDDVAYRLRLLVNNNYFLPPAHAKPSPADFAPSSDPSKKSNKSPSPTFFDRFRVGKSKSKPSTPTGFDHTVPMLRTTSDSITSNHSPRAQQSKPSGQMPHVTGNLSGGPPRGRVVVVREKVEDIMVAAKQAEQDLKAKSAARMDQESQNGNDVVDNAIDPTDAVDIPLPSPNYPFAVQASALHGLGVQDSVGADVLAVRLPPTSHSYEPAEDRWRKALLQEAVHHSLDNTADSSFSNMGEVSTPNGSFRKKSLESDSPLSVAHALQQKIIDQPTIDIIESTPLTEKRPKSANTQRSKIDPDSSFLTVTTTSQASRPGSFLPLRAETPSGPMTSLGPAPRRIFANTPASLSQTDLTHHEQQRSLRSVTDSYRVLRRSHSSPHLAEGYDSSVSRLDAVSPPLLETLRYSQATTISTGIIRASYHTIIASPTEWEREDSFLEMAPPRASFTTTRSEYSQASASPTLSTFQEVVNQPHQSGSDSHHTGPSRLSSDQHHANRGSPSLRYSAMSPPPRMSSSLAHVALPPPPRGSSLANQSTFRSQIPIFSDSSDSIRTGPAINSLEATTLQIVAPEPTTPPLPKENRGHERHPFRHRRSQSSRAAVPSASTSLPISVQPTPGPSSPTSFFDTLQSQPNAMDDLESSSDEENEQPIITSSPKPLDLRSRTTSNASPPRALIMRHGNFSTPYIRSAGSFTHLLPVGHSVTSKKPIENVPLRPSKHELPSSSYDFFNYAQDHPPVLVGTGLHRPATDDDSRNLVKTETLAQESLKKLDGMLMRHMEDERDTIKRIAHNLKQTAQP